MRIHAGKRAILLTVIAVLLFALVIPSAEVLAEDDSSSDTEGITISFYNGDTLYHTQRITTKNEDGHFEGTLYEKYPSKEFEVFLYWKTDGGVSAHYFPGMTAVFTQDTSLYAQFGDAAMTSENIEAVRNGKSTYEGLRM